MKSKLFRRTIALLSAAMLLSLTACGAKEDPNTVFDEAVAKNAKLTDMDTTMNMKMTMSAEDVSMDIDTVMDMKASQLNTAQMLYFADMDMTMAASGATQSVNTKTFYKDGYCYIDSMGMKMKYAMDLSSMMDSLNQSTEVANMSSSDLKELSMEKNGDNRILTFTADPSKMNDQMKSVLGSVGDELTASSDLQINVTDISGKYIINKEGYYTDVTINMVFDMNMMGAAFDVTANVDMKVNNPGKPVTVTLPDTEGYEEVDMSDLY